MKRTQASVRYRAGNPIKNCGMCGHFEGSIKKTCAKVTGEISPFGFCDIYKRQANPFKNMRALAKGGHAKRNEPVIVGERGPEVFVPDENGGDVIPLQLAGDVLKFPKIPGAVSAPPQPPYLPMQLEPDSWEKYINRDKSNPLGFGLKGPGRRGE